METVDIFVAYSEQNAERVLEVLREAGLEPLLRDRSSSSFPTNIGTTAAQHVAVAESAVEQAIELVKGAIKDGVVAGDDGEFV